MNVAYPRYILSKVNQVYTVSGDFIRCVYIAANYKREYSIQYIVTLNLFLKSGTVLIKDRITVVSVEIL